MSPQSDTLLIAFGGMRGRIGMPPFEFLRLTGAIPVKRLFVRDLRQAWYHRGLEGHGPTLQSVADTLQELIDANHVRRLVVTGNSAGGYAALVVGTLLNADTVVCFSPQTILDLDVLGAIGDHRWDERLREVSHDLDETWIDLREGLTAARNPGINTRYKVFFDESLEVDRRHAERLSEIDRLRLYRFGRGGHYLVRALRDCGALERILREAVGGPVQGSRTPPGARQRANARLGSGEQ